MTITAENVVVPSAVPDKRRALGRGLESLLPGGARVASSAAMAPMSTVAPDGARPAVLPVVVRATPAGRFVLILGERRCRASKLAGKPTIPAIVRSVSDQQAAEMTVVENLQRQDLNCLEQTLRIADEAVRKQMSVLQLKDLVDHTNNPMPHDPADTKARWQDPNVREIQMQMERTLGVRVRITDRNGKGRIVIEYATLEDFDRVVETLKGSG